MTRAWVRMTVKCSRAMFATTSRQTSAAGGGKSMRCASRLLIACIAVVGVLAAPQIATAQPYPNKPVRIVVPYAAGGSVDPIARLLADRLSRNLGQSVFVENRPGAGGNIGIEAVVRGPHDGYTLLATPSGIAVNPSVYSKVPYSLEKDLTPIALANRNAMIVLVSPN